MGGTDGRGGGGRRAVTAGGRLRLRFGRHRRAADDGSEHRAPTTPTTVAPAGTWSKALRIAPGANLSVVSCPAVGTCVMGSAAGQTYRLYIEKVTALGPPVPSPSPQGGSFLSCATPSFCAAAPNTNQVALFNGSHLAGAGHPPGCAGHHGHRLHRPDLLHHRRR